MAEKTALSKKDAEAALKAFTDIVAEELKKGEKIEYIYTCFSFICQGKYGKLRHTIWSITFY